MTSTAIPDSEQEAFRASWERFASLYTQAMTQPEVRAIPEVHAVLDLLGDAVLALAADIHQTRWPPAQYGRSATTQEASDVRR